MRTFSQLPFPVTIWLMIRCMILSLLLGCLLIGCGSSVPVSQGGFQSPDPAARMYAIRRAGLSQDHQAIRPLIELLNSDDAAERLLVIQALERITGTRLDYDPYANAQQRADAITRWVAAADANTFVASSQP
jgi:HEAT repeat protein